MFSVFIYLWSLTSRTSTRHVTRHFTHIIPNSQKFSRDPIFTEGQYAKISWSNFRGWTFQKCSTHNTRLAPPLLAIVPRFQPAKDEQQSCQSRRNGMRVAYDRGYAVWLSRVQGSLVCCCWRRAVLRERSELSRSICCSSGEIWFNRWSRPKKDIGMFDILKTRWDNQLQSYWQQTLLWRSSSRGVISSLHVDTDRSSQGYR